MSYFDNAIALKEQFITETFSTLYMTFFTIIFAGILGLIFGVILAITDEGGIKENKILFSVLDKVLNLLRSLPFIILLALLRPLTRLIVGTGIGPKAAIVPLVFGTFAFLSRQVYNALVEVDKGVIEASKAMGDSPIEIIFGVYLKESTASLIRVFAVTLISLIGLTAMAGAVGAGGLGNIAIAVGYNRFQDDVVLVATVIILIIVYLIQGISDLLVKKLKH